MIDFYLKVRESTHIILYLEKLRSRKKEVSLLSAAQIINRRAWVRVLIPSCEAGPKILLYSIRIHAQKTGPGWAEGGIHLKCKF